MKLHSHKKTLGFALLVLIAAASMVPAAHAQIGFGVPAKMVLRPKPVALPATGSSVELVMPALNMTLLEPGPVGLATTTNLFAQVALGGGYTTIFSFLNTGADTVTGTLFLTGNTTPLIATFTSAGLPTQVASSYPVSINSGGTQIITADAANPGDPTSAGWARVESTGGSLQGVATFQLSVGNTLQTIVGVLSAAATSLATIPIDDDHTIFQDTGYAIANPSNSNINIKIVLLHPDGTVHTTLFPPALNPLPPGGHVATFVWQDLNDAFLLFRGSMVMIEQASIPFSVTALVLNNGLFTAIPVIPSAAPGIR
jgi:hypothetical protein